MKFFSLRTLRIVIALFFFTVITLMFVDFTGTIASLFGWTVKLQFMPALLSLNIIVLVILIGLTLIFGRVYCSTICPLGVLQDFFGHLGIKAKRNRYSYSPAITWLRIAFLALIAIGIIFGIGAWVAVLAPYSAYGRIAQNFFAPVWAWGNNLLAGIAEAQNSYAFYRVDIWWRGWAIFIVASVTLGLLAILAWRGGRTYCNTVCPVGTVLGYISKFSLLRPVISSAKCNSCGLCSRNCKSSCIDSKAHTIDYSRCVACMDCIGKCHKNAITYSIYRPTRPAVATAGVDDHRRNFLTALMAGVAASTIRAQEKTVDGGLAAIVGKKAPKRRTPVVPPGAVSLRNLRTQCTACQLCVSQCPNGVLRPSVELEGIMQPVASYERGYCRPECTRCSDVCPTGAIKPISQENKSSVQIGHAVWVKENCVPLTDGVKCGNCARHCPVGAISMVRINPEDNDSLRIPAVNEERCIGCGACEHLCPSRPFSAIYVEGHEVHRTI